MDKTAQKTSEKILLVMLILVVALCASSFGKKAYKPLETLKELEGGWYYIENGEKVQITLPAVIETGESSLDLYYEGLTEEEAGKMLTTKGAQYDLEVYLEQKVLYKYEDEAFPRNEQMSKRLDCDVNLPAELEEQTLKLTYHDESDGKYSVNPVYIGDGSSVLLSHMEDNSLSIAIVFTIAMLGVISIVIALYLHHTSVKEPRFFDVALFLLICGIWCATDSSLVQNISGLSPIVNYISFYAFMLLAIPMLHFVRNTGEMGKYKSIDGLVILFYMNALLQTLLNHFGNVAYIDMLFITHLLLFGGSVMVAMLLIKEYRKKPDKEIRTILSAFVVVAAGGVLSLILYWLLEITYYDMIFELGIVVFIVILFFRIIITTIANMRYKTEMEVYQRLAREDGLTGMKNRRAFEEYLDNLEESAYTCKNVALFFMDLNKLKEINDSFGHQAGDELIIGAARLIEKVFEGAGDCFRIGGDEFCVIVRGSTEEEQKFWENRLDMEIEKYNRNNRYPLSLAVGVSFLRDKKGNIRTISDWKYEADQKMYRNKGWYKLQEDKR